MKYLVLSILCVLCMTVCAYANVMRVDIEAMIDGRDLLIIQGDTLQWHHLDYAAVGRHLGANEPTIISTWLGDTLVMDQVNWIPDWPEELKVKPS